MKRRYILILDLMLPLLLVTAGLLSDWMLRFLPPCGLAELGLQCPSCGGTRCVQYFASGNLVQSFSAHPYFFLTAVYAGVLWLILNIAVLSKGRCCAKLCTALLDARYLILWAIGLGVFGILRNFW